MVNATVDNDPVSIQLSAGQSTTVPSNETWKVQIVVCVINGNASTTGAVKINSVTSVSAIKGGDHQGQVAPNTVLTGGDTVTLSTGAGASISGFVVDS